MGSRRKAIISEFTRVIPYVWPYRRRLYFSCIFAVLVGLFWGMNLTAMYPLMKVLLEGKNLDQFVAEQIEESEELVQRYSESLERKETLLSELEKGEADEQSRMELMHNVSKTQTKLSAAVRSVSVLSWLNQNLIRYLPKDRFEMMVLILGSVLVATLLKGLFIFMQDMLTGSVVELSIMSLRKDCFRRVLDFDFQTIRRLGGTPGLISRFTFDLNQIANGLQVLGGRLLREPIKALTCIVAAFWVNWRLTLLSLVFVPLAGYIFYRFGRSMKKASHRMMESMSRIVKNLEESFDSVKIVTAYGRSRTHRAAFHHENKEYFKKAMKIVRIDSMTNPTIELFGLMAIFCSLLPGAYLVLKQTDEIWNIKLSDSVMDISQLGLMYVLLIGILDPLRKLSRLYGPFKRSIAAVERIFELIDTDSLVKEATNPIELSRLASEIRFDNVTFAYQQENEDENQERQFVLNNVNLTVSCGETIVVVGENGSGKSTFVNLLPRFYDPLTGSVLIDGKDIRKASWSSLRSQMGIVTQETMLFDQTIYQNIAYGNPEATQEQILEAARSAHVLKFADSLPEGLSTVVGEKGSNLSGGQRQRVALARAIVRDPAIMIMDEATSAIDSQSEQLIHETLREFLVDRTAFIITHSVTPSILELSPRIVVMDSGRVVATGSHSKLIENCPQYQRLFHAHRVSKAA